MIVPSAADELRCIEETLESVIKPALRGTAEKSAAATMSHLLRHVRLRIEREGQALADDIAAIGPLLAQLSGFCAGSGAPLPEPVEAEIDAARTEIAAVPGSYLTLQAMGERAARARRALLEGLCHVQQMGGEAACSAQYRELRTAIRGYLAQELRREGELIHPAFEGRGPRR